MGATMGGRSSGNVTGPRAPSSGGIPIGHAGASSRGIGGVERYYKVHGEPETASQAARLQNPRLKLHTSLEPWQAMSRMLLALGRAGFDTVLWFNGGVEDPSPERKEGMHVRDLVEAMAALEEPQVPLLGLKAVVRYRRDARVRATATVGRMTPAKVKLRVRGAVFKSDWYGLKKLVDRKLEDIDRDE